MLLPARSAEVKDTYPIGDRSRGPAPAFPARAPASQVLAGDARVRPIQRAPAASAPLSQMMASLMLPKASANPSPSRAIQHAIRATSSGWMPRCPVQHELEHWEYWVGGPCNTSRTRLLKRRLPMCQPVRRPISTLLPRRRGGPSKRDPWSRILPCRIVRQFGTAVLISKAESQAAFRHLSRILLIAEYAVGMEIPAPIVAQPSAAPSEGPEIREPNKMAAQMPDFTPIMRSIENLPPGA